MPTNRDENGDSGKFAQTANAGLVKPLIEFLDRNLAQFSRSTRDVIGIGFLIILGLVVLHGFIAPTYIEGRLMVVTRDGSGNPITTMGKRYFLSRGNEVTQTNDNAVWMLPVRGFFPQRHTVLIRAEDNNTLMGEFNVWAPWPAYNAFRVSNYKVTVRPGEPVEKDRIEVTHLLTPAVLGAFGAVVGDAVAQPSGISRSMQFVLVHLQGLGDVSCTNGEWCGTKGESRRLEGFSVRLPPEFGDVRVSYSCHLQGTGDTQWMRGPNFLRDARAITTS